MRLDRLLPIGFGAMLGGACALLTIVLALLASRTLLARGTAALSSPPAPIVATIPPLTETPLPLADAPLIEIPEALLPTVTPTLPPLPPVITPLAEPEPVIPPTAPAQTVFGETATRVVIPAIGLDTAVVLAPREGDSWAVDHLGQAVGHLQNTASPGMGGNIVLAGHYTLEETNGGPGPFYKLKQLVPGDVVTIYQGKKTFNYMIDGFQTVDEKAVDVTFSSGTAQLTLLTCTQWDRNQGEYLKRLIVKGHLL